MKHKRKIKVFLDKILSIQEKTPGLFASYFAQETIKGKKCTSQVNLFTWARPFNSSKLYKLSRFLLIHILLPRSQPILLTLKTVIDLVDRSVFITKLVPIFVRHLILSVLIATIPTGLL